MGRLRNRVPERFVGVYRAVSPVVGVALMVVVVVLLASVTAGFALTFDEELQEPGIRTADGTDVGDVNPWSEDDLLAPKNATAGAEDVRYRLLFEVKPGDNVSDDDVDLVNIDVAVDTGDDMFTEVGSADFEKLEVNGETLEASAEDITWDSASGGSELAIEFTDMEYDPSAGDEVVLVFGGVDNPEEPGTYAIDVELNGDDRKSGQLEIVQ